MDLSAAVDGFRLAYTRGGEGPPVVLLHGWPGSRLDYGRLLPLLHDDADVVVPDLRGFGHSQGASDAPASAYAAPAQAASVLALIDELALQPVVLAGYDVGSRVAQAAAAAEPERIRALVISPPVPGVGERVLSETAQAEFWYQPFHQLALAAKLIDGRPDAVRAYLTHFWDHWSAPGWTVPDEHLDELVERYAEPGAFTRSIAWYRSGAGTVAHSLRERPPAPEDRLAVPSTVVWPEHDPLFPLDWSDRLDEFFSDAELSIEPGAGHFLPLEAPERLARAIRERLDGK